MNRRHRRPKQVAYASREKELGRQSLNENLGFVMLSRRKYLSFIERCCAAAQHDSSFYLYLNHTILVSLVTWLSSPITRHSSLACQRRAHMAAAFLQAALRCFGVEIGDRHDDRRFWLAASARQQLARSLWPQASRSCDNLNRALAQLLVQ